MLDSSTRGIGCRGGRRHDQGPHSRSRKPRCKRGSMTDRKISATRQGWSKGIGGGDAFMKLCSSSSGCKTRPAKGEPAQAGSEPGDDLRNGVGEAEARERVGHGHAAPKPIAFPEAQGAELPEGHNDPCEHWARRGTSAAQAFRQVVWQVVAEKKET